MDLNPQVTAGSNGAAATILVIGPLDSRRRALRNILTPPQWEVREAATYGEAIAILDNRSIEVAICDTEIEDGNWQVLLANLQSRANPPNLIVSSRLADERLWAEVLNLGGYDVLVQPFDSREVLRVARMARMARSLGCQSQMAETHAHTVLAAAG
jgi:DNA-binding NtrC family response regulator